MLLLGGLLNVNIKERVKMIREAKQGATLAKSARHHLMYLQSLRPNQGSWSFQQFMDAVEEHKADCPGCTVAVIDELREKLHLD